MEASDKANAYNDQADELERNAVMQRKVGEFNVMRQQISANKKFGAMDADYAASGVASDSASVLAVIAASHVNSEFDRLNIVHQADFRATQMEDRARTDRGLADQAKQMGYFNAFSSIFSGAAKSGMQEGGPKSREEDSVDFDSNSGGGGGGRDYYSDT